MYIFFLFYFLLGLDNMGFYYLIQIKIDWLIDWLNMCPGLYGDHAGVQCSDVAFSGPTADEKYNLLSSVHISIKYPRIWVLY